MLRRADPERGAGVLMGLAATIPGLALHRARTAPRPYCFQTAKRQVDQVLYWMADNIPDDLLEWLQEYDTEQWPRVMACWREIETCDQNQDQSGVAAACSSMVLALRQGLRRYNSPPVAPMECQGGLF